MYAEKMAPIEAELRAADAAWKANDSEQNGQRFADALAKKVDLEATFPFIAAGAADETH